MALMLQELELSAEALVGKGKGGPAASAVVEESKWEEVMGAILQQLTLNAVALQSLKSLEDLKSKLF